MTTFLGGYTPIHFTSPCWYRTKCQRSQVWCLVLL